MLRSKEVMTLIKKGQVLLEDFVISMLIFSVVVAAGFKLYHASQERESWSNEVVMMWDVVMSTLDYIIKNPGIPAEWNSTTVERIGLASQSHVVLVSKFLEMMNMTYEQARAKLGVGGYDYYITMKHINGTPIKWNDTQLSFGVLPPSNSRMISAGKRYTYIVFPDGNKTVGTVELEVWR